jgi:hypothetical protein
MRLQRHRRAGAVSSLLFAAVLMGACDDDNPSDADGSVTAATVSVNPGTGSAETVFNFNGQITVSDDAPVTYRWEHDNGDLSPIASLDFDDAGTQTVTHTWDPPGCSLVGQDRWVRLQVLTPNPMTSSQTLFHVDPAAVCP